MIVLFMLMYALGTFFAIWVLYHAVKGVVELLGIAPRKANWGQTSSAEVAFGVVFALICWGSPVLGIVLYVL